MTNEEYIFLNRNKDIRSLALSKMPEGVNALWALQQIEGYQLALRKLPLWAKTDGLHFPPRISMEQCSSEATAQYKARIIQRLLHDLNIDSSTSLMDITGGFGVDFSYMARCTDHATYVEQQPHLCDAARHNMPLLGLNHVHIINGDSAAAIASMEGTTVVFADPARRDTAGNKTVAIGDCTPDIALLQDSILLQAQYLIVKLSPMLDITAALKALHHVCEVHVISVKGECKELLFVQSAKRPHPLSFHCANLDTCQHDFVCQAKAPHQTDTEGSNVSMPAVGQHLFEPNASILKAGMQDAFADHYALSKLHPMSNLYVSPAPCDASIPARQFTIEAIYDFSKQDIKKIKDLKQANLTIRNFPATVADLRKRMKLKEGGSKYLFATTLCDGSHAILCCVKVP